MGCFWVLSVVAWLSISAQSEAQFEWPRDLMSVPAANATNISAINAVVNGVLARQTLTAKVREFRFVPLENAKRIDLIASIDTSGRGMYNALIALWQTGGGYDYAILPSEAQGPLGRDVIDLDGAGVYEVVAGRIPGGHQGHDTDPIPWYGVYSLRQGKWIDVSAHSPQLYHIDLTPKLSLLLQVLDQCSSGDKGRLELYKDQVLFVRFKYERNVGHNSDAGLKTALEWAGSGVPAIQVLAVETLGEIADASAISALKKLAESEDVRVRISATGALTRIGANVTSR